jgi:hypothetical protein
MTTFHILSQYVWPDGGPDGLYAEELAIRLQQHGHEVRLVGGQGVYRHSGREKPQVPLIHVQHYRGRRGNLAQTFIQYCTVKGAFKNYIEHFVKRGDVVVATSAPPTSVYLADTIKRRGAHAIYWLQDYYPELIRGIHEYPAPLRGAVNRHWDRLLLRWDRVVKIGSNLAGPPENSMVIRNWPTITFEHNETPEPKTALYSGNLGYAHDVDLFAAACEQLRDAGYRLTIRADGYSVRRLPAWLDVQPLHVDPEQLKHDLVRHEVHLIAGHPRVRRAIFPSKIWNSIALGRRLVCTGFEGEMAGELESALTSQFERHLEQWLGLLLSIAGTAPARMAVAA